MAPRPEHDSPSCGADGRRARLTSREELGTLLHSANDDVLAAVLENPLLDESHLAILLERKDLPGVMIGQIAKEKKWLESYPLRLRIVRHPHTPRLLGLRLVKQLYLFDLVNISLLPSVSAELKRIAEEMILGRLNQLPLGQKFTLARRGSGRVAAALLAEGLSQVVPLALDNAFLNEGHVLRVLAREEVPANVAAALAQHAKWSCKYNVRMALVRHPLTPLARVLSFLPDLTLRDLEELSAASTLRENLRQYIRHEIASRRRRPMALRRSD